MKQFADLKMVKEFIKTQFLNVSILKGVESEVNIFSQTGYDFVCAEFEGYIAPYDYADIICEIDFS